jgi:hypothetical protein
MARENRRAIGADAEKGRVTQRNDSGIAEDEIERHREQAGDEDFIDQQRARGDDKDQRGDERPERDLARAPTRAARQMCLNARRLAHPGPRANRPCGRISKVATITA